MIRFSLLQFRAQAIVAGAGLVIAAIILAVTGLHLAHVIIGLIVLTVLSTLAGKPEPTRTHIAFFEGGACFWHMVDLLWIVIFPLIFLAR